MYSEVPMAINITFTNGTTTITSTVCYHGVYNNNPFYQDTSHPTVGVAVYVPSTRNRWIVATNDANALIFANDNLNAGVCPKTGWSTCVRAGVVWTITNVQVHDGLDLPDQITTNSELATTLVYNADVLGWVSTTNEYVVLLHPTSPFNRSGQWRFQNRNTILGYYDVKELASEFSYGTIPTGLLNPYNSYNVAVQLDWTTAITSFAFVDPTTYVTTVVSPPLDITFFWPIGRMPDNYVNYIDSLLTGGKTISPTFGTRPGVYTIDEIYDPDDDYGKSELEISRLYVPKIASIVVDNVANPDNPTTYVVISHTTSARGPRTNLKEISGVGTAGNVSPIITITNDICMAFYVNLENAPTRITIDNRLVGLAENAAAYQLSKTDGTIISANIIGTTVNYGSILVIDEDGIKKFDSCYTNYGLNDGDNLILTILDAFNYVIGTMTLLAKEASALSDLQLPSSVIVDLAIGSNQPYNGGMYLLTTQQVNELAIFPQLVYGDGSKENLTCNTTSSQTYTIVEGEALVYGLLDIPTEEDLENPGTDLLVEGTYEIMFKYYIPRNTFLDEGMVTGSDVNGPFITKTVNLYVVNDLNLIVDSNISKLVLVPTVEVSDTDPYDSVPLLTGEYGVIAYFNDGSDPAILKSVAGQDSNLTVTPVVDGLITTYTLTYGSYTQTVAVRSNIRQERHISCFDIKYSDSEVTYTPETGLNILAFGTPLSEATEASLSMPTQIYYNIATFVNLLYTQNSPPEYGGAVVTPTHYAIRLPNANTNVAGAFDYATGYIPLDDYFNEFQDITSEGLDNLKLTFGAYDELRTVVVEFYKYNEGTGEYVPLYGSPLQLGVYRLIQT